jgi:serine/threonine protein kinase
MDKQLYPDAAFTPFELDDKYVVSSQIKVGGMGVIYAGETKLMHRKVAIKILHAELAEQKDMLLRFKMEAEIASSLNHPNIVNVFGSGVTSDGKPYLAMDYVEGESLADLIEQNGKVEISKCIKIFVQLARAVEYTHEKNVIHRDLKPSNVMLRADEKEGFVVKLLDFGIAKSTSVENTIARELTLPGTVFGSVLYMSPEQVLGKQVDFRSDIYSFGCLLFHALSGKPPFESKVPVDCMQMHLNDAIPELSALLPEDSLVESLASIINKCMQKDPSQRFESASQLRASLEKLNEAETQSTQIAGSSAVTTDTPPQARPQFTREDGLAALSIILIAIFLVAVPYLVNLDLPKAEAGREAQTPVKKPAENKETTEQIEQRVDDFMSQSESALKKKNTEQAEDFARKAYMSALSLSPDDPKIAEALFQLGQVFEMRHNYQGALQAYNWTLSFRQAKFGEMAPQTISVREKIHETEKLLGKPQKEEVSSPPHINSQ